jgi:hypothetical protein
MPETAGRIILVPTPIGNLADLTLRGLEILRSADRIACEDTRHSGQLLAHHGISGKPLISLHDHNEARRAPELVAAARAGATVGLVTSALETIGQMSCNPAIGGVAKGTVVREVDALGGLMGRATDLAMLQFRMLNQGKGPAVWAPRAQCDRGLYRRAVRSLLEQHAAIHTIQGTVARLLLDGERVAGLETLEGRRFGARGKAGAKTAAKTAKPAAKPTDKAAAKKPAAAAGATPAASAAAAPATARSAPAKKKAAAKKAPAKRAAPKKSRSAAAGA